MKNMLFIFGSFSFLAACGNEEIEVPVSSYKNVLDLPEEGFQVEIEQRDTIEIPSQKGDVTLDIDDITKGQTQVQIVGGGEILLRKSMREGESEIFDIHTKSYNIECLSLVNKGIGMDWATFLVTLSSKTTPQAERIAQREKIQTLIRLVETSDITFIRNGEEHSGKKAADHLRSKYEHGKGQIQTLNQFIEHIASKSSMSGEPYKVRKKNGQMMNAEDWYKEVLTP